MRTPVGGRPANKLRQRVSDKVEVCDVGVAANIAEVRRKGEPLGSDRDRVQQIARLARERVVAERTGQGRAFRPGTAVGERDEHVLDALSV